MKLVYDIDGNSYVAVRNHMDRIEVDCVHGLLHFNYLLGRSWSFVCNIEIHKSQRSINEEVAPNGSINGNVLVLGA